MSELLLDSLEIKGYRCFEHLTIEKLGRVNLIVGKNSVGKTTFLESLEIFFSSQVETDELLQRRNEIRQNSDSNLNQLISGEFSNLLFQKNGESSDNSVSFQIGQFESTQEFYNDSWSYEEGNFSFIKKKEKSGFKLGAVELYKPLVITSTGFSDNLLVQLWNGIIFTDKEDEIIRTLQIISPNIERIAFVNYPNDAQKRVAIVKVKNSTFPVSLARLGEGLIRLLGISLALVNCKNKILLIDEIENGLHYSILPDVWKLIFKTAKDLNVQVFATTHSKDCIEAFTQAAIDDEESEGMLIRLERNKDDKIIAKTIEEERLADAINYGAEVR
jgi:AAA15 family ATPase/GTPase